MSQCCKECKCFKQFKGIKSNRDKTWLVCLMLLVVAVLVGGSLAVYFVYDTSVHDEIMTGIVYNADVWPNANDPANYKIEPSILSASCGYSGIMGIESGKKAALEAGVAYIDKKTCTNGEEPREVTKTSKEPPSIMHRAFGKTSMKTAVVPVCFSYPVLLSTASHGGDLLFTLNDGSNVLIHSVSLFPGSEYNERHCLLAEGPILNNIDPSKSGAKYPVKVKVIQDEEENSPLQLVGPGNILVSAVGLELTMDQNGKNSPYSSTGGPKMIAAKVNLLSATLDGEGIREWDEFRESRYDNSYIPNSGSSYTLSSIQSGTPIYRLRVMFDSGVTADGINPIQPIDYEKYFKIWYITDGVKKEMTKANEVYKASSMTTMTVLGLADLGKNPDITHTDNCYVGDYDHYIDIIIIGEKFAIEDIRELELIGTVYNAGGPGPTGDPNLIKVKEYFFTICNASTYGSVPHKINVVVDVQNTYLVRYDEGNFTLEYVLIILTLSLALLSCAIFMVLYIFNRNKPMAEPLTRDLDVAGSPISMYKVEQDTHVNIEDTNGTNGTNVDPKISRRRSQSLGLKQNSFRNIEMVSTRKNQRYESVSSFSPEASPQQAKKSGRTSNN